MNFGQGNRHARIDEATMKVGVGKIPYFRKTKRLTVRPLVTSDYARWKLAHSSMHPQQNRWDRKNKSEEEQRGSTEIISK